MKVVFYVYLCLLLLCVGRPLYAGKHNGGNFSPSNSGGLVRKRQVKPEITVYSNTLLDNADLDADDDSNSDLDEYSGHDKFPSLKYSPVYAGHLICSIGLVSIHYNKCFNILSSFRGNLAPIYIRQRVLRV